MIIKNLTRTISYILILLMVVSLFACGKKKNSTTSSGDSNLISEEFSNTDIDMDEIEKTILENTGKIVFSSPRETDLTVYEDTLNFNGICNKNYTLLMNGEKQEISEEGYFSISKKLNIGKNKVTFKNGDFKKTFTITHSLPLIKSYTPSDKTLSLDGNTRLSVTVVAKSGATITAIYNGKTTTLSPDSEEEQYTTYRGVIITAKSGTKPLKFKATLGKDSQEITATKIKIEGQGSYINTNPVASLQNKGYVDVGTTYVAEVVSSTAECFLGGTIDDYSRPTVNYLPRGTMDYCSTSKIYDSESGKKYYILRNNTRVYAKKGVVKISKKKLPETNKISYAGSYTEGNHFFLNFNVDWRAPFRFNLGKQGYRSEKGQDYSISSANFTYVDITFCYAEALENFSLPANQLFSSYEIFKNEKDYTLRLYLKSQGVFYGWKASYNSSNQLVFSFLNPAKIQAANNKYGYSLKGIKIVIDPGHGGSDSGTYNAANSAYTEKYYTLIYAKELANRLLQLGATVYMTRTEDKTMSLEDRYNYITATGADLAISVHFNGSEYGSSNGYFMGYFNPYTYAAAKNISSGVASTGIMNRERGGTDWHYFNLSRVSYCPTVLTENGYLTSINDYKKIKTPEFRKAYVDGIVGGIIKYFVAVSYNAPTNSDSYTPPQVVISQPTESKSNGSRVTVSTSSKYIPSRVVVASDRISSSSKRQESSSKLNSTSSSITSSRVPTVSSKPVVSSASSSVPSVESPPQSEEAIESNSDSSSDVSSIGTESTSAEPAITSE